MTAVPDLEPPRVNAHPVEILRLAAGGDGVGRWVDGKTAFVPRTAPGDIAVVELVNERRRHVTGRMLRLDRAGPGRVSPQCAHYLRDGCGGCQFQHLDHPTQIEAKRTIVGDALRRVGGLDLSDPDVVPCGTAWGYRNTLVLTARGEAGVIGFHHFEHPGRIFDLERCEIAAPALIQLWGVLRARRAAFPAGLSRLVLRLDREGGRHVMAEAKGHSAWPMAPALAGELDQAGMPSTLWLRRSRRRRPRWVAGAPARAGAVAFAQANPSVGHAVKTAAIEALGPVGLKRVWDLYAGVGETARRLAELGASVDAVERDAWAVAEGKYQCEGLAVRWHEGTVETVVPRLGACDLVIVNPPRAGLDARVTRGLLAKRPDRLVYVSCDPATLARDLSRLMNPPSRGREYRVTLVRAYDMFPQTAHVETLAVVERS